MVDNKKEMLNYFEKRCIELRRELGRNLSKKEKSILKGKISKEIEKINDKETIENMIDSYLIEALKDNLKDKTTKFQKNEYKRDVGKDSFTFDEIKKAYNNFINDMDDSNIDISLAGSTIVYLLNDKSNRMHDDLDFYIDLADIDKLRKILKSKKLYSKDKDSLTFVSDGNDYGLEINYKINDKVMPIRFYPYKYDNNELTIYGFDNYQLNCRIKEAQIKDKKHFIKEFDINGKKVSANTLEFVKKERDEKDRIDEGSIDFKKIKELHEIKGFVSDKDIDKNIKKDLLTNIITNKDVNDSIEIGKYGYDKEIYKEIGSIKDISILHYTAINGFTPNDNVINNIVDNFFYKMIKINNIKLDEKQIISLNDIKKEVIDEIINKKIEIKDIKKHLKDKFNNKKNKEEIKKEVNIDFSNTPVLDDRKDDSLDIMVDSYINEIKKSNKEKEKVKVLTNKNNRGFLLIAFLSNLLIISGIIILIAALLIKFV